MTRHAVLASAPAAQRRPPPAAPRSRVSGRTLSLRPNALLAGLPIPSKVDFSHFDEPATQATTHVRDAENSVATNLPGKLAARPTPPRQRPCSDSRVADSYNKGLVPLDAPGAVFMRVRGDLCARIGEAVFAVLAGR